MSGHSKWAGIKHKKAAVDAKRGKEFAKLSRAITVAAREMGGDPEHNSALRDAIQKAKDANMPGENIERAVKRGTGEGADVESFLRLTYEGYGPNGVAIFVEVLTDNKNRSAADIRRIFDRGGGKLGTDGSVSWIFERKGVLFVEANRYDEERVINAAIEAGAEDVLLEGDTYEIRTDPADLLTVREGLVAAGVEIASGQLTMIPNTTVALGETDAKKTLRLLDALEDNDDVQEVYANFDIPDEIMAALAG